MYQVRFVEEKDDELIDKLINSRFWEKTSNNKDWAKYINADMCSTNLKGFGRNEAVIIEETYLCLFSTQIPWYSSSPFLVELFLHKLYKDGHCSHSDALKALEQIAKQNNCVGIITGSSVYKNQDTFFNVYQHYGYKEYNVSLFKEI